jgi:hypothetical protein
MNIIKIIGTALAVALPAIGHSGVFPIIPSEVFTGLATLIVGWLHLPQPAAKVKAKAE